MPLPASIHRSPARSGLALAGLLPVAVALAVALAAAAAEPTPRGGFRDPFAYCAAVGTIDAPDARWQGPPVPREIAFGLRTASGAPADADLASFRRGTSWRCAGGAVWACTVGANLPCQAKPALAETASSAMRAFCAANPGADVIPAVVTGHETLYAWSCTDREPRRGKQVEQLDVQGFIASIWYRIARP